MPAPSMLWWQQLQGCRYTVQRRVGVMGSVSHPASMLPAVPHATSPGYHKGPCGRCQAVDWESTSGCAAGPATVPKPVPVAIPIPRGRQHEHASPT